MALIPGTRLGVYEVTALIGAGGMGQVYRARDTRLNRDVALKVLPDSFANDPDRLARFTREAQTLAALNHPNIAHIHGLEESPSGGSAQAGIRALVMELVEGEDLSQRIARGAISLDEAWPIARQICEALEAAHEHGIIHRDLKPANIKVRSDGTVKVLDFGLAKALDQGSGIGDQGSEKANSPTITRPAMTQGGVILGTASYMSPEQARGKTVDTRADIWAFGCVLFEMLTGARAFRGETLTDVLAAVIEREPEWSALPAPVPASLRTLLRRCLQKDPGRRFRDVWDVRIELEETAAAPSSDAARPVARHDAARWKWASASLGILALAALALAAYALTRPASRATGAAQRVVIMLPPDVRLTPTASSGVSYQLALSPDDRQLVFAGTRGTVTQLYVRRLDQYDVRPLPGTENAIMPFFSPDGSWVGFQSGGQLRKVSLAGAGGIPEVICNLPGQITAAAWGADGEIVFASRAGLSRVVAVGGTPEALTTLLPGELAHNAPQFLPGNRILFTVVTSALGQAQLNQTAVLSKTTRERHPVLDDAGGGHYLGRGHLAFFRAGSLWTVPFDAARAVVEGTPIPRVNDVFVSGVVTTGTRSYAASASSLLYVAGSLDATVMWVERDGRTSPLFGEPGAYQHPVLSPDGTRVAFDAGPANAKDLWVYDVPRGTRIRLTTSDGNETAAIWTPDGTAVAYRCNNNLCRISANGGGQPDSLPRREYSQYAQTPTSWSPDGRILVYQEDHPKTGLDVWMVQQGQEPSPVLATSFNESGAVFSPDGRFLAYISNESGNLETYVRPYPKGTEKWLISTNGGAEPVWSLDGNELFYREKDTMMAVPVTLQPVFKAGVPRRLFDGRFDLSNTHQHYSAGGGRFLKVQRDDVDTDRLHVILNFAAELTASAPAGDRRP